MVLALLIPTAALGATLTVGPDGDYSSIGAAVSVSTDGDRVEVAPGVYVEQLLLGLKDVEVVATEGAGVTSIVGDGSGPVVVISDESTEATHLSGFTLVSDGHRCVQVNGGNPRLSSLVMVDCGSESIERGGAILVRNATVTMDELTIQNATARYGAGLDCADGAVAISDSAFEDNFAFSADGGAMNLVRCEATLNAVNLARNRAAFNGGGIAGQDAALTVNAGEFSANQAIYGEGGGLHWVGADDLTIADSDFASNTARQSGGGLHLNSIASGAIDGLSLESNRAEAADSTGGAIAVRRSTVAFSDIAFQANQSGAFGGALFMERTTASAERFDAELNETTGIGGAIYADLCTLELSDSTLHQNSGTSGGGGLALYASSINVEGVTIRANTARGGEGGGAWLVNSSIESNGINVLGNLSMLGGGLFASGVGSVAIARSVFQENVADFDGGGLYLDGSLAGDIQSSDLVGNETLVTGTAAQAAIAVESIDFRNNIVAFGRNGFGVGLVSSGSAVIRHNDLWGNESGAYSGSDDRTGLDGNIAADPEFVELSLDNDFSNDDLHLTRTSPCIGTGDPETATESDSTMDIGAFGVTEIPDIDLDADGYPPDLGGDCNDADPTIHPGAEELCGDDVDNNCDGSIDEGCPTDTGSVGDDTGSPVDTGSNDSGSAPGRSDDTGRVPSGVSDPYAIEGTGCRCSMSDRSPSGWLALVLPLLLAAGRRHQ